MPGGFEWIVILLIMCIGYGIPIAIVVYVIMTLNGIRRDVIGIREHLERISSTPPQ